MSTSLSTPPSVAAQIARLPDLPMAEIRALWQKLVGGDTPTHNRQFLERRIAYRLQELEFRKVDANLLDRNQRRIESLVETGSEETRPRLPSGRRHGAGPRIQRRRVPSDRHRRRPV